MQRVGRRVSLILFALASLSAAHALAYLITFRCWACHDALLNATHAAITGSALCLLAIIALVATIVTARRARTVDDLRISPGRLALIQAIALVAIELLERHGSVAQALGGSATVVELGLVVIMALLFSRFARVVEHVTRATLAARPRARTHGEGGECWSPHLCDLPRTVAHNVIGFLRAPPLPA